MARTNRAPGRPVVAFREHGGDLSWTAASPPRIFAAIRPLFGRRSGVYFIHPFQGNPSPPPVEFRRVRPRDGQSG